MKLTDETSAEQISNELSQLNTQLKAQLTEQSALVLQLNQNLNEAEKSATEAEGDIIQLGELTAKKDFEISSLNQELATQRELHKQQHALLQDSATQLQQHQQVQQPICCWYDWLSEHCTSGQHGITAL